MSERDWQPIKTAPKDGTVVLLFSPDAQEHPEGPIFTGFWVPLSGGAGWMQQRDDCFLIDADPSHWMPLPEPPDVNNIPRERIGNEKKAGRT